jgi:hypothetical protein
MYSEIAITIKKKPLPKPGWVLEAALAWGKRLKARFPLTFKAAGQVYLSFKTLVLKPPFKTCY